MKLEFLSLHVERKKKYGQPSGRHLSGGILITIIKKMSSFFSSPAEFNFR